MTTAQGEQPRKNRLSCLMLAIGGLVTTILAPVLIIGGFFFLIKLSEWHMDELYRKVEEAQLVGRPEEDTLKVLGPPTSIWDRGEPDNSRTYNYQPRGFSVSLFQVYCRDGVVTGYGEDM